MQRKHLIIAGATAVVLVLMTAGASALMTRHALNEEKPEQKIAVSSTTPARKENIQWNDPAPPPAKQATNCDDGNIAGLIVGGAAGGLIGNQVGSGKGNTAATIGGAVGGAYLGKEHIPLDNVTCR
jgi:uncharacterized protein YcfJ